MHSSSLQTDNGRDVRGHSGATLHSRHKELYFFLFSGNRGGSSTLPFSFRAQCVMLSSLSFLHFGMTKIAKIMQKCRRILLKYTFFFFLFWKAPFHFGRVFRDYFFKMKKILHWLQANYQNPFHFGILLAMRGTYKIIHELWTIIRKSNTVNDN